jgi:dihydropteroate synthase
MHEWQLRSHTVRPGARPLVMGIVNVTPDSFSDGGRYLSCDAAIAHAREMIAQGADIIDIGGESTRPGSHPVPVEEELRRVLPVVEALAGQVSVPLSIDTSKHEVARACLAAGAGIINDVTALADPQMIDAVRGTGCGVILMHMQGTPLTMQQEPRYGDVVGEIVRFFEERLHLLEQLGIARARVAIDPGIGFGKTRDHNMEILARLGELQQLGRPVCLGVSRKGFLGRLLDRPVEQRLAGSLAAVLWTMPRQAVQIVRVHDVAETRDALLVWSALAGFCAERGIEA